MESKQMGVALIGAGNMGTRHAEAIAQAPGLSLRVVIDVDADRASGLAGAQGADHATDLLAWQSRNDIDAVYVCVPASFHQSVAVPALTAGKHVFCEKPLALRLEDGRAIAGAADAADVVCAVNFQHRHRDPVKRLRRLFTEAHSRFYGSIVSVASVRPKPAMHDATMNGGPMIDNVCHFIDLVRYATGAEPTAVSATGSILASGKPEVAGVAELAVDSAVMVVEFGDRGAVQILMSWGLPKGVAGTNRIILVDEERKADYAFPSELTVLGASGPNSSETVQDGSNPLAAQAAAFDAAVHGSGPVSASAEDGLRALETSRAILVSIEAGTRVAVERSAV